MVKKPSGKKAAAKKTAKKKAGGATGDLPGKIIETAFALALERGWRDLSLAEIAESAGLTLSQVHGIYPSKAAVLGGFSARVDAAMLGEAGEDLDLTARDRLFDVVMRRFDALQPQREALGAILQDQMGDPLAVCCGLSRLRRSMATALEAAGISSSGCRGVLRVKGLSAIYLSTLRVFLRDDSEDMAKTMAHLDKQLGRVDALIGRLRTYRPGHAAA